MAYVPVKEATLTCRSPVPKTPPGLHILHWSSWSSPGAPFFSIFGTSQFRMKMCRPSKSQDLQKGQGLTPLPAVR